MKKCFVSLLALSMLIISCNKDSVADPVGSTIKDINTAEKVSVDRFSDAAGKLFKRSLSATLPAANAAISLDSGPFITTGLDRTGAVAKYYNLDVQSTTPDDIYVFFRKGATTPLTGQNNIIPTIPGDAGYNDFWLVNKVIVPDTYIPNTFTSESEILTSAFEIVKTNMIVNCPVVPFGSTAAKSKTAGVASALTIGWYKGKAVAYFEFAEAAITATATGKVPIDDIYVMFNDDTVGPASGFKVEAGTMQTHNVLGSLPGDSNYSPLWDVQVISNTNFANVKDLAIAAALPSNPAGATVNCPIVK
jgi:hypothetical protein